jgi:hypothetical protein
MQAASRSHKKSSQSCYKSVGGKWDKAPCVLNLCIRWVVSLMLGPLYPQHASPVPTECLRGISQPLTWIELRSSNPKLVTQSTESSPYFDSISMKPKVEYFQQIPL